MTGINLFWDSCVFIRYLTRDSSAPYYQDICTYIEEARQGKWKIHFSTITYAEIKQEYFIANYGKLEDFFRDLGANFIPIDPNPNILRLTGELRSAKSTNPGDPTGPKQRAIATPDAIIMVSCLFARDQLGLSDIKLHSTDEGKGKGWAGRAVPVIGFDRWFPHTTRTPMVSKICGLSKDLPKHPQPSLLGNVIQANFNNSNNTSQSGSAS